jgi:hypothetical protein
MVTGLAGVEPISAPHHWQNFPEASVSFPHLGQNIPLYS